MQRGPTPRRSTDGFTLIELIAVVAIVGATGAVAVAHIGSIRSDARIAAVQGAIAAVGTAMNNVYARSIADGTQNLARSSVRIGGVTIATTYGYPTLDANLLTAAGLGSSFSIQTVQFSAVTSSGARVRLENRLTYGGRSNCHVVYVSATATTAAFMQAPVTVGC